MTKEELEKENAELERKLEQTEKDLADYQFNYPTIKELEKENAELKADNDARKFAMAMSEKVEKQLRKENAELRHQLNKNPCVKTPEWHCSDHKKETKAHGMWHTKLYRKWAAMKTRCTNPRQPGWKNYGGKGITLYPDWYCFSNFAEWALKNGYKDGLTIDRINNNEGYNPGNCRWVTMKAQANNRTNNHFITYKGQTKSLADWCSELNLQYHKTKKRLYAGWSIEKAFEER